MARLIRARKAGSPQIVIPTASSAPSCSEPSRYGLARAEHAERLVRRPTLTAPARAGFAILRIGAKKRDSRSNKETDEEKRCAALKPLDKKGSIQGRPENTETRKRSGDRLPGLARAFQRRTTAAVTELYSLTAARPAGGVLELPQRTSHTPPPALGKTGPAQSERLPPKRSMSCVSEFGFDRAARPELDRRHRTSMFDEP